MKDKYVVYENWTAQKKAVVHIADCGHTNESHERLTDNSLIKNHYPNDRWYGYFDTLDGAIEFTRLLPRRTAQTCKHCI